MSPLFTKNTNRSFVSYFWTCTSISSSSSVRLSELLTTRYMTINQSRLRCQNRLAGYYCSLFNTYCFSPLPDIEIGIIYSSRPTYLSTKSCWSKNLTSTRDSLLLLLQYVIVHTVSCYICDDVCFKCCCIVAIICQCLCFTTNDTACCVYQVQGVCI